MPKIRIKSYGEVEVDSETAKGIQKMIEDKESGMTWVKAGIWSGRLSDISGVIHTRDKDLDGSNKHQEDNFKQHLADRRKILNLSPSERAKNTGLFKMYYKAIKMEDAPEDIVKKVEDLQEQYFTKYPQKCFTNHILFNKVIYPDGVIPKNQKLSVIQMGVLNLVGNVLNQDVISSKYGN